MIAGGNPWASVKPDWEPERDPGAPSEPMTRWDRVWVTILLAALTAIVILQSIPR